MTDTLTLEFTDEEAVFFPRVGVTVNARRDHSTGAWEFVSGWLEYAEFNASVTQEDNDGNVFRTNTKVPVPFDGLPQDERWLIERKIEAKWWKDFEEAFQADWEKRINERKAV